jgi:hypothetical protein
MDFNYLFHRHQVALFMSRVQADVYLWGGYRYSNSRDALAAAKRNATS